MGKLTKNQAAYQALLKQYSKALIAEMVGTTRQAITKWQSVPYNRVAVLSKKTGIPPEQLLPEPYSTA